MIPSKKKLEAAFPGKGRLLRKLLDDPKLDQEQLEHAVNVALDGHGAEAIFGDCVYRPDLVYINLGDTYATTLLYDYTRTRWSIGSWGDWIEAQERRGIRYE